MWQLFELGIFREGRKRIDNILDIVNEALYGGAGFHSAAATILSSGYLDQLKTFFSEIVPDAPYELQAVQKIESDMKSILLGARLAQSRGRTETSWCEACRSGLPSAWVEDLISIGAPGWFTGGRRKKWYLVRKA